MTSPIQKMLGKLGDPMMCNRWIHWFSMGSKPGDPCMCGKTFQPKRGKKKSSNAKDP